MNPSKKSSHSNGAGKAERSRKPAARPQRKRSRRTRLEAVEHGPEREDFTGGITEEVPSKRGTTGDESFDRRIDQLVEDWDCGANNPLIEELLVTSLRLGHDTISEGDLKLINRALKELRTANRVFAPYHGCRKIAVYGSARTRPDEAEFQLAEAFSRRIREQGYMVITGAGDGIMGAAQKGAGRKHGFGLNIRLPFEQSANKTIDGDPKLITFNYFFTRKVVFVKEAHAFALFPGGFGTMDECFELLTLMQTGKATIEPTVMVDVPGGDYWSTFDQFMRRQLLDRRLISEEDFNLFKITTDLDEAVEEITGFYRVFHSYRFVRDKLVIRLNHALTEAELAAVNERFGPLLKRGTFTQTKALPAEASEPHVADLPRLVCRPVDRGLGWLRCLINQVNQAGAPPGAVAV